MSEHELKRDTKRAFRSVMREMNRSVRFDTPEELEVLREHIVVARKRSLLGMIAGGLGCGFGWRYCIGRPTAPFAAACGAIAGLTYGMFTVRQKLFIDLLSIPEERSPFSRNAHRILVREMPDSALLQEVKRIRRERFPFMEDSDVEWTEPKVQLDNLGQDGADSMNNTGR